MIPNSLSKILTHPPYHNLQRSSSPSSSKPEPQAPLSIDQNKAAVVSQPALFPSVFPAAQSVGVCVVSTWTGGAAGRGAGAGTANRLD